MRCGVGSYGTAFTGRAQTGAAAGLAAQREAMALPHVVRRDSLARLPATCTPSLISPEIPAASRAGTPWHSSRQQCAIEHQYRNGSGKRAGTAAQQRRDMHDGRRRLNFTKCAPPSFASADAVLVHAEAHDGHRRFSAHQSPPSDAHLSPMQNIHDLCESGVQQPDARTRA